MSWNILAHEYTQWNTPNGYIETKSEKQRRWSQCLTWLQILKSDIICLQEVTPAFIEYLLLNYKEGKTIFSELYEHFYEARTYPLDGKKKADGCLTLVRKDKFSVKGVNPIHFKNLLSNYDPRLALAVYIEPKYPSGSQTKSKDIVILNVHLDGTDYKIRYKQIIEAMDRALAPPPSSNIPLPSEFVVCGDFNEDNVTNMSQVLSKNYSLTRTVVDQNTSIFGIIDHIFTTLPKRNLGKIDIYPGNPKKEDGRLVAPPYLDDTFPSDHYILTQNVIF